jgi:hypothetical protein
MAATWRRLHTTSTGWERIRFETRDARLDRGVGFLPRAVLQPVADDRQPLRQAGPHWSAWSRAALRMMEERNSDFVREHGLEGRSCRWDLDDPHLVFPGPRDDLVTDLCAIGSLRDRRFRWAWADPAIPPHARRELHRVREFGELSGLEALISPEAPADRVQALELSAVAARVLYAPAVWVASVRDGLLFLALSRPQRVPRHAPQ